MGWPRSLDLDFRTYSTAISRLPLYIQLRTTTLEVSDILLMVVLSSKPNSIAIRGLVRLQNGHALHPILRTSDKGFITRIVRIVSH